MTGRALFVHASSDLYGSDLACLHVARGAIAVGWAVDVTLPGPGPLVEQLAAAGATVQWLDPLKPRRADLRPARLGATAARWGRNYRRARRLGAAQRFDLVYTTTAPTLGGALLARRWRAPHVYHVHEIFWYPRAAVAAFERVLARSDVVVCCSGAVADQFGSPSVRERCRVVHTGAELAVDVPERLPFDGSAPVQVVCVARLNEWKGQEVLVDAIGILRDRGLDVRLSLVGGVYGSEIQFRVGLERRVAELRLGDRVRLEGERRDAARLVATADVFALPSRRPEPFGMALVEAMALGRPVVATDAGGPREIVTDGVDGLLVPPGDPRALADAIAGLAADVEGSRRLGAAARARARDFPIDAMVRQVLAAFDDARSYQARSRS